MTTSSGSGPRRSARARARRQPPDDDAPPSVAPPPDAGGPSSSSPPSRRRRGDSPSRRSVRAREDDLQPPAAVLDDDEVKHRIKADEQKKQGMEIVEAEGPNEVDENAEALKEAPFWLPDGWIINVRHGDGGSTYRYYTSPVSDYTFSTDMAALDYLFSEMDERILESEACADNNKLPKTHAWLPDGWVVEVRAGKMRDKMYKFYVHLPTGMRFFSKEEVLRYVNEGAISGSDVKGLCDTISEDNILAQVEFNPDGLPKGWVKEVTFRKCDDGIRKDPSYTDPVSHLVFRTLKSVMSYLETGEISKHAYLPRRSVTEIYSFDGCTDLPRKMLKRLKVQGKKKQKSVQSLVFEKILPDDQTSNRSEGGTSASMNPRSDPKETRVDSVEAKGKEPISSETTKRPRGRPRKISKQTNEITSDCTKSSDNEITPIKTCSDKEVKNELDTETGKRFLKENAPEDNEMEKKKQKSVESLVFEKKLPDDWTSNCSQGDNSAIMIPQSDPKEKRVNTVEAKGNEVISSETTKRPRGRPRKIPNPTNETTSECTKGSDKEITPIETGSDEEVKKELDTETGKKLSKENTPEDNEMEKKKQKSVESLVFEKKLPDDRTSNCSQGDNSAIMIPQSDPKEKRVNTVEAKGNEVISSETTKRPRGRPRKIPNQTNETTSECTKGSDKEITPIETGSDEEVKKELDTETGKQLLKENTPEDNEMEKKKQKSVESLVFEKKLPDDRTSNCSQGDTSAIMIPRSDPKEKRDNTIEAKGNEVISSETTKRPRGRPRKIPKQTNETTSECTKSTDKEITPIETGSEEEVKKELDTETGEQMSKENTPDDNNEMEKHASTIPEVDDKSDLARSILSWRRGSPGLVTDVEMSEQENDDPAENSGKPTTSAVQKFYMRRNSNQIFKKECKENADHL